jgi:hypothetical protein
VLPPPISELVLFAVLDALLNLALLNGFASLRIHSLPNDPATHCTVHRAPRATRNPNPALVAMSVGVATP